MSEQVLSGCAAIVTGASRGVGKGVAIELGMAGATVYVTGRSKTEGDGPKVFDETLPGSAAAYSGASSLGDHPCRAPHSPSALAALSQAASCAFSRASSAAFISGWVRI